MATISTRCLILALLGTLAGCQPAAPPAASLPAVQPPSSSPASPAAAEPDAARPIEPVPAAPLAIVSPPIAAARASPPWVPVSAVEPFNDKSSPTLREWTASSGGFHTAAKMSGFVDGQVQLRKAAGGHVMVPLDKLSEKDRQYVTDLLRVDPSAKLLIGKVFLVMDHRTVSVMGEGGDRHLIHLEGIDDMDDAEQSGKDAKEALLSKIKDKHVWVEWRDKDRSDFLLGQLYLDGRNINLEMIAEGHARLDPQVRVNSRLANAELIARHKRLGLWKTYAELPFGSPVR